ncbi:hypothetical protein ACIGW1_33610 [Streptomyces sp. NPDC053780]|uniref:hypothetical protein n=1 Tax=unclassified Streptomyces TaxID=2593676 RepID=UPI00342932F5
MAGRKRWTMRWKAAVNAFAPAFDGRLTAGHNSNHTKPSYTAALQALDVLITSVVNTDRA